MFQLVSANRQRVILSLAAMFGVFGALHLHGAEKSAPEAALTEAGQKLSVRYAELLQQLKAQIAKAMPTVDEQKKSALQKARDAVKKAVAEANAAQQPLNKVQTAKALVDHAKGKWIGGAEKGIAQAEAALKKATTDSEREAAKKDLAKWQANKEDGIKALKERQEAYDKAKTDESKLAKANKEAQEALSQARANELNAAKALLAELDPFLSSEQLDATLIKCALLTEATPKGLAEFAQQGKENEALVENLLSNDALMKLMLEAGGAEAGKYGQAMKIYSEIQKTSSNAREGILQRLALATSLEHSVPVAQRNSEDQKDTALKVDPLKRYLHYEKAYQNGELDPAFKSMTTWECRMIVNSSAPDHVLQWGRNMLRNYRPDHIYNPDYGWRYSGAVRTDVAYRHSNEYKDNDSLEFFQNVIKNGGICGRRAFFGRFIVQSFGLPVWGVTQHAHAALGRWTPAGWVVNLGANWQWSWFEGRSGLDFLLETQARKFPEDFVKVLRAEWISTVQGEPKFESMKEGTGGLWNILALYKKKEIVADKKPAESAALGQDLAEANETADAKSAALVKAEITDADKKIVIAPNGIITIPAAACSGAQLMASFGGGHQLFCGGKNFNCDVEVPADGKYALTARVVTVHDELHLQVTSNKAKDSIDMTIPYTCGMWQTTAPVEVTLAKGKNSLSFSKPTNTFSLKDITLTPVK